MSIILGKICDESSSDYHASDCVSHSKLEVFRKRPLLFKKRFIDKTLPQESSPALALGSAAHCLILEPSEYANRYAIRPEGIDRRTKDGKAAYEAFLQANAGKEVIEMEDARMLQRMADAVHAHPAAKQLLAKGEPELVWRANHELLPVPLQCRTDWVNCGSGYIADVKTIDKHTEGSSAFSRNVVNFGYHRQAAFYQSMLARCGSPDMDFYFIVVEKAEPYGVVVYKASQAMCAKGFAESEADIAGLDRAFRTNAWANMPQEVIDLDLPGWYKGGEA